MSDKPTTGQDKAAPKIETVTIEPPDEFTGRMWTEYCKAVQQYKKISPEWNNLQGQCAGALALIRAKWVKVSGPDSFMQWITGGNQDDMPLAVIGVLARIGDEIEAAVNAPLEGTAISWKKL